MARRFFKSRRSVALAVVVALTVAGVGASTASAITFTDPDAEAQYWSDLAELYRKGNPADFDVSDMKVAAPSSVITATGSESPTRRVQEVNNWRPNTQSWIDAKSRIASGSGLTTADVAATGRWQPKLSPMKALGIVGTVGTVAEVGWFIRDNALYPALGMPKDAVQNTYCTRLGNVATSAFEMLVGADCGEWRLQQGYQSLVGTDGMVISGTAGGITHIGMVAHTNGYFTHCYSGWPSLPSGSYFESRYRQQGVDIWVSTVLAGNALYVCTEGGVIGATHRNGSQTTDGRLRVVNSSGDVLESMESEVRPELAEWITRVRCTDGSTRYSVSESFQQEALGGVAVPREVELAGCDPVAVDIGLQVAGSGTSGAGGGWSSVPGTSRAGVQTSEVPTAVQDWMESYPQCMDGSCLLELKKEIGGTMELDCFAAPEQCADWQTETAAQTAVYRCYYANAVVDLAECNVYGRTFQRQNVQTGTAYSDPATGETVKTGTGTTTTTNPGAQTVSMSSPVADPATTRTCWPTGWGVFNPFEWVYQPVKCAFEWAFVPRESKLSEVRTALRLSVMNSQPAGVVQAVQAWGAAVPSVSGCAGPTITLDLPSDVTYTGTPISACSEPASTLAMVSRAAISIVFILFGLFAITRYVGRVFGFTGFGRGDDSE